MSILSFPRAYVNGWICWNVPTANNNDYIPTYAAEVAELNYPFLASQYQIGGGDPLADVREWATSLQLRNGATSNFIPAEWNYFGDNGAWFVDYGKDYRTLVTGGETAYNIPAAPDPLIGSVLQLKGNPFGDATQWSPPRLVDNNPVATWTSQVFFDKLVVGTPDAQQNAVGLAGKGYSRVHSQLLNFSHRQGFKNAGVASVVWQSGFSRDQVRIVGAASSPLLRALDKAMREPSAQGLMFRFCTFTTLYFVNGILNDYPDFYTEDQAKLNEIQSTYYHEALRTGVQFFAPAYSYVVGTIGVWNNNELATAPQGRILMRKPPLKTAAGTTATAKHAAQVRKQAAFSDQAAEPTVASASADSSQPQYVLGVAVAEVHPNSDGTALLSIDMSSSLPNTSIAAEDVRKREAWFDISNPNLGPLAIVSNNAGKTTTVGAVYYTPTKAGYPGYDWTHYKAKAGIIDLPLTKEQAQLVNTGTLEIRASVPDGGYQITIWEDPYQITTDQRNEYVEVGETRTISLSVLHHGKPAIGVQVAIVQYSVLNFLPWIAPVDEAALDFVGTTTAIVTEFGAPTEGDPASVATVGDPVSQPPAPSAPTVPMPPSRTVVGFATTNADGIATFKILGKNAGFATFLYSVYKGDPAAFRPDSAAIGNESDPTANISNNTVYFSNVRILPADAGMPREFCDLWNRTRDSAEVWQYVYRRILMVYDVLFPAMMRFMPFSNAKAVEAAAGQLAKMIDKSLVEKSTLYMPITRDLSEGKRQVLLLWCSLVLRGYPPVDITPE